MSTSVIEHLKPSERVLAYLEKARTSGVEAGKRLPTMRQISDHLQVSAGTVRNVLQKLEDEGRIEIRPGSGAFWGPAVAGPEKRERAIGINANQVGEGGHVIQWLSRIYGAIIRHALENDYPLRLKLLPFNQQWEESTREWEKELPDIEGCIIFPFVGMAEATRELERRNVPCVYYNPPYRQATSDFVSPDYFGTAQRLGRVWQQVGKRRVLIVLAPGTEESVSCQMVYGGLTSGLSMGGDILPEVRKLTLPRNERQLAKESFAHLMDNDPWRPDAIYCMADELALGVLEAARERGFQIPNEVSLVGGNGTHALELPVEPISACHQPVEAIGQNLLTLLMQRIRTPHLRVPGVFLPMPIIGGPTTLPQENQLFQQSNPQ